MLTVMDAEQQAAEDTLVALGNREIVVKSWRPDDDGIVPDGIVGGDGAGEAVAIRYLNRYVPTARITTYFYVVDACDRDNLDPKDAIGARYYVEEMIESYIADRDVTDEVANETWCDYDYHPHDQYFATEAEAEVERDRLAAADDGDLYLWDGTPNQGKAAR